MEKNNLKENLHIILDKLFTKKQNDAPARIFFDKIFNNIDCKKNLLATPWNVSWQICANCNLRCKHCFFEGDESKYDQTYNLTNKRALTLVDELFNDLSVVNLTITGGEPFLRKDIFEILKKIKSKNIILWQQTNGTLITKDVAKKLSKILNLKTDCIQISLDASNEELLKNIRGANVYKKTLQGIKNLLEYDIPVSVNCTALSTNIENAPKLYDLCSELKVNKFSLTKFTPMNEMQKILVPDSEILFNVLAQIIRKEKTGLTTPFEMSTIKFFDLVEKDIYRNIVDNYLKENKIKAPKLCNNISCHIHNILYINSNGNVSFCFNASEPEYSLGNIKDNTLIEIWEKRHENLFFQPRKIYNMLCKKCKYFSYCKGGCMASAYKKYGKIDSPDALCKYAVEQFNL